MKTGTPMPAVLAAAVAVATLAGCSNPYALRLGKINYAASQKAGVIQFTDPKLYKREALINERRAELGYLDDLLKESAKLDFKIEPEIVRELEVIRAFAGTVGLKFDPASAIEARRASETGDIEQRIQVTRLEMQLGQLQRDAELLRQRLPQQTDLSATPAAPGTTVTAPRAGPTPSSEDITKILTTVDALRQAVTARLDKKAEPPARSSGTASPLETFRDRRAYRDALKDAVNAASLDELHDKDGNSLFRVQLQATALPEGNDHLDTLGILRMEIVPPTMDDGMIRTLYQEWLWYVNQTLNVPPDTTRPLVEQRFDADPRLFTLGDAGDLFTIVKLEVRKQGLAGKETLCKGVRKESRDIARCWYPQVALPGRRGAAYTDPEQILDTAIQRPQTMITFLSRAVALTKNLGLARNLFRLDSSCRRPIGPESTTLDLETQDDGLTASQALALAGTVHHVWPSLGNTLAYVADMRLDNPAAEADLSDGIRNTLRNLNAIRIEAQKLLAAAETLNPSCKGQLVRAEPIEVPPDFRDAVVGGVRHGRVTVYDVAPTERTQRVSTVARAADAVAMAAALAGSLPQAGFGGSGNFAFTRTAIGKADALERAPLVVGFAEPAHPAATTSNYPAFGWLLGPKVTLDPKKQQLVLQHHLAPYEIHADISLPGWWPYFGLKASTAWAPDWRNASRDGATLAVGEAKYDRDLRVPMRHNTGDLDGLTALILRASTGQQVDRPRISKIEPAALSMCAGQVTIAIEGEGIWRTTAVQVGGRQLDATNIRVLPDMRGIAATVDADKIPVTEQEEAMIRVWTHNGSAGGRLRLTEIRQPDGKCAPTGKPASAKKTPVIDNVVPAQISLCERKATFTVYGKNLKNPIASALGTITALARDVEPKDGTLLEVDAQIDDREHKIGKLTELPLIVRTADGVASRTVTVVPSDCPRDPATPSSGEPSISEVVPEAVSVCDPEFTLTVRGKGFTDIKATALGTIPATSAEVEPKDGSTITVTVRNDEASKKINELKQLTLMVRTSRGLATKPVQVKAGKCS